MNTITLKTTNFHIEKTNYRIIVNAFNREEEFKDAKSVKLADKIKEVDLIVPENVWGMKFGDNFYHSKMILIFDQ